MQAIMSTSIILTGIVVFLLFLVKIYCYGYWRRRGVPGPAPVFLLGNIKDGILMRKSMCDVYTEIYKKYPNLPIVGVYKATIPALIIRDPEIIKEIVVKSFSHFQDNDFYVDEKVDPILGKNPFALKGEHWKTVRSQLTPCFTSGKMKAVFPIMNQIGQQLVEFVKRQQICFNGSGYEAKELCTRFTLNNVASCVFGLEGKCFEEENAKFRLLAQRFLTPSGWTSVVFTLASIFPFFFRHFPIRVITKDVEDELLTIVKQTIKYRHDNNIVRNDFIQFMSELKKTAKDFTDMDVTAHAGGFFGDGYETSSVTMSFVLYCLAANQAAQENVREEIHAKLSENKGEFTYEIFQEFPYLDAAITEAMRLFPPLSPLLKTCTKPYTYHPKEDDGLKKPVTIEEGMTIILPLYGIQRDPKNFENAEEFIPERFLGENKANNNRYANLPFGEGPRACLGQRFGLLQIKVGIVYLLKHFEISVNSKTKTPFKFHPQHFLLAPLGGIWLDYKKL